MSVLVPDKNKGTLVKDDQVDPPEEDSHLSVCLGVKVTGSFVW